MDTNQDQDQVQTKKENALWTIILFIAADGLLANFAVESLTQLYRSVVALYGGNDPNNNGQNKNNQAKDDAAKVVVTAQFAVDAPGGQQIPRYIFDDRTVKGSSIENGRVGYLNAPPGMSQQEALSDFLQWVFSKKIQQERCQAEHYALILWGHGPELLLQPPAADQLSNPSSTPPSGESDLYLTPEQLRVALTEGLPNGKRLDIIAFDTCSMSMFEMAFEIKDKAKYMVASQEEVPDPSFPYDQLVGLFREKGRNIEDLIIDGARRYVEAYQDYITDDVTGMNPVMLSGFRLDYCESLRTALHRLACALYEAFDPSCVPDMKLASLPGLLMEARECSREFVAGLYVDLKDFCTKLDRILSVETPLPTQYPSGAQSQGGMPLTAKQEIRAACKKVIEALPDDPIANTTSFILANSSNDPDCHGVSLYFPYLGEYQYEQIEHPMVKGGRDTTKLSSVVNQAASELLMSNRRDLIIETESYYEALKFAIETGWYYFIVKQWSGTLAQMEPNQLDFFYSAQQCAVNLGKCLDAPKCPPVPESSAKPESKAANRPKKKTADGRSARK